MKHFRTFAAALTLTLLLAPMAQTRAYGGSVLNLADSGAGSLRQAIADAASEDTITSLRRALQAE